MVGFGILFAPIDIWIKAYFAMGAALLVQSCITMTKTLRDVHEGSQAREPHRGCPRRAPADGDRARQGVSLSSRRAVQRPVALDDAIAGIDLPECFTIPTSKNRYIRRPERNHPCPTT